MAAQSKHQEKSPFHPNNKHQGEYDFIALTKSSPELAQYVLLNKFGKKSINFFDSNAVKALNRALLTNYYGVKNWDIPTAYLCPPIPGRAEYIHRIADLLYSDKTVESTAKIRCLDIGVGANCIYPIIGVNEYGWNFVGSDIDKKAIDSATKIIDANAGLKDKIELRHQKQSDSIFRGIIRAQEQFHLTICNPPFHASANEAKRGTLRKLSNLKGKQTTKAKLNFGGQSNELWCNGGEKAFVLRMITESREFAKSCTWFSSLISKEANLPVFYKALKHAKAKHVEMLEMHQGNKRSRIIAWSFC
jgi:23S rRNA (adenine1618-N6)-methyltransferase